MSDPSASPDFPDKLPAQHWVRPGVGADTSAIEAWLATRAPLAVPDARARRLSLDALLAQGGQGICLLGGTDVVQDTFDCLLPVSLVHSLSVGGVGGRVAMVAEWWAPAMAADAWLAACLAELADWCRAHGIRAIAVAPGLTSDATRPAEGFGPDASGMWVRNLVPTAKRLG